MGFMDKVKASVQDVTDTVSKTIDNEKMDSKIRDEVRKVDKAYQEIGEIIVNCMLSGEEFDTSMVASQYHAIVESRQAITDLNSQRTEPSERYEKYLITGGYVMPEAMAEKTEIPEPEPVKEAPEPAQIEAPEPEPEIEEAKPEPVAKEKEVPNENTAEKDDKYADWVDVNDESYWNEEKPAKKVEAEAAQETASEPELKAESAAQESSSDGGSMLSRIQGYQSNNYSGDKTNGR